MTYGTFRPDDDGSEYQPETVERDFAAMAAHGLNAVRTYTVPPRWLLDAAARHGLWVMVGLPWEQHVAFLDGGRGRDIERRVREGIRACAGHPAVLCYTIGNEIPSSIVRWYGRRPIERFLKRLYRAAKAEDPEGLVTYVNYPSTEYLQLPFLDFVAFNVYLETQERLNVYLARLQNIAGDRPLVMAEIGLDSQCHGEDVQAWALYWQVRTAFAAGCAGTFAFAWTDEWHRGGHDVEDWDFGLTDRARQPKAALYAVQEAYAEIPFPAELPWPRMSVVVCSYNGARTIRDCLDGLHKIEYPDFEVIVVDDGSTDATAAIAREYDFQVISTENRGLSAARNLGMELATGDVVAYIDDDAIPDPHWLLYLAYSFISTDCAAIGGPNIPPLDDGDVAECVANAPGGPVHILLSDTVAEHIPGCNMAVRKVCLQAIGGFDPQFRVAGDDVDVCWRLQQRGWKIGFSPAAMVWHHRRDSVRGYWRQQQGYGRAEALLERKWPDKYNAAGHRTWVGRVYGSEQVRGLSFWRDRIYQGTWGSAPFQSLYQPASSIWSSLPLMPEWYLVILALAVVSALGLIWSPLLLATFLLAVAASAPVLDAGQSAARAAFPSAPRSFSRRLKLRALTAFLHLLQPVARLHGRLISGLTPWRHRGAGGYALTRPRTTTIWSERWQVADAWLMAIESAMRAHGARIVRGSAYDHWDIEVRGGLLGGVRLRMATEEHGAGHQLLRFRTWPLTLPRGLVLAAILTVIATAAAYDQAWVACAVVGIGAALVGLRILQECSAATATAMDALRGLERSVAAEPHH